MKFLLSTLGCKVNQYETAALSTMLISDGHTPCTPGEQADIVIINTCAVTAESGRKSRQTIRRLKEENPGAVIGVSGCYSQLSPEAVAEIGADVIFGSGDRIGFIKAVETAAGGGEGLVSVDKPFERRLFEKLPSGAVAGRTRAMLKIQDGCVNFCSYCIIPYTRGRLRSLPIEDAVLETQRLASLGYKEIVLTGIEVASYGVDLEGKPGLADIICAVSAAAPGIRIRLGSLEPTVITEDFCRSLSSCENICRHFHLSMQSGCNKTLKAMNRKYDTDFFLSIVNLLRQHFPGCGITTDMITGFPGETDEDQALSLAFIRKCAFSDMHIFPYSRRPGTPADKMPSQCTNAVKNARARQAQTVADIMKKDFLASSVGSTLPVLFETCEEGLWTGHSDTYLLVSAPGENLRGRILSVRIDSTDGERLYGTVTEES